MTEQMPAGFIEWWDINRLILMTVTEPQALEIWRAATARAYERAVKEVQHMMCACGRTNVGNLAARRIKELAATEEAKK